MKRRDDYHESEAHKSARLREAQMMREAAARQGCRRCGAPLEEGYDVICLKCDYDDWHEEYPDIPDLAPVEACE
jgi:hypothetical protein